MDSKYIKALLRRSKANELLNNLLESFEDLTAACILEKFKNAQTIQQADKLVKKLGEKIAKERLLKRDKVKISKHFVDNFYIALNNDPIYNNQTFIDNINKLKEIKNSEEEQKLTLNE